MSTPLVIKCGHLADEVSALPSLPCPRVTPEHPARPPPSASQAPTQHCTSSHRGSNWGSPRWPLRPCLLTTPDLNHLCPTQGLSVAPNLAAPCSCDKVHRDGVRQDLTAGSAGGAVRGAPTRVKQGFVTSQVPLLQSRRVCMSQDLRSH